MNDDFDSNKGFGAIANIDVAFKNLMSDLYSKDLSEKAISGRNSKALRGEYLAAYAPYGYRKVNIDGSKKIEVDQEAAPIVRRIFDMANNGIGSTDIARILNAEKIPSPFMLRKQRGEKIAWRPAGGKAYWSGGTVTAILKDKRYLGHFEYGKTRPVTAGSKKRVYLPKEDWIIFPCHHEAIVSQELFDRVQVRFPFRAKAQHKRKQKTPAILSGKLRCGACKHILSSKKLKAGVVYFCNTKQHLSERDCFKGSIPEAELEKQLLSVISSMAKAADILPYMSRDRQKESLEDKKKQMKDLQDKMDRLMLAKVETYEKYKSGSIDKEAFLALREKASVEMEKLNQQATKMQLDIQAAHQVLMSKESGVHEALVQQSLSDTLEKELIDVLIDTIYLDKDGSVQIMWAFADLFDSAVSQKENEVRL